MKQLLERVNESATYYTANHNHLDYMHRRIRNGEHARVEAKWHHPYDCRRRNRRPRRMELTATKIRKIENGIRKKKN